MNNNQEERVTMSNEAAEAIVAPEIVEKFLEMLDPDLSLSVKRKVKSFVAKRVAQNGVCVFWNVTKKCRNFTQKYFIDLGQQEFIITPSTLMHSENYRYKPELVLKVRFKTKRQGPFFPTNSNNAKKIDPPHDLSQFHLWGLQW